MRNPSSPYFQALEDALATENGVKSLRETFYTAERAPLIRGLFTIEVYINPDRDELKKFIPTSARGFIDTKGNLFLEGYADKREYPRIDHQVLLDTIRKKNPSAFMGSNCHNLDEGKGGVSVIRAPGVPGKFSSAEEEIDGIWVGETTNGARNIPNLRKYFSLAKEKNSKILTFVPRYAPGYQASDPDRVTDYKTDAEFYKESAIQESLSWEDQFLPDFGDAKEPEPIGSCEICGDSITSGKLCNRCKFILLQSPNHTLTRRRPDLLETKVPYKTGLEPLPGGDNFNVSGEGIAPLDKQEVDIMAGNLADDPNPHKPLRTYGPSGRWDESIEDELGDTSGFEEPEERCAVCHRGGEPDDLDYYKPKREGWPKVGPLCSRCYHQAADEERQSEEYFYKFYYYNTLAPHIVRESIEDDLGDTDELVSPLESKVRMITKAFIDAIDGFAEYSDTGDAESGPSMDVTVSKKTIQLAADSVVEDFGIDYETIEWSLQYARKHGIQYDWGETPLNVKWIEQVIRELAKKHRAEEYSLYEGTDYQDLDYVDDFESPSFYSHIERVLQDAGFDAQAKTDKDNDKYIKMMNLPNEKINQMVKLLKDHGTAIWRDNVQEIFIPEVGWGRNMVFDLKRLTGGAWSEGDPIMESSYREVLRETRRWHEGNEPTLGDMRKGNVQNVVSNETEQDISPALDAPESIGTASPVDSWSPEERSVLDKYNQYAATMEPSEAIGKVSADLHFPYAAVHAIVSDQLGKISSKEEEPARDIPHTEQVIPQGIFESSVEKNRFGYRKILREAIEDELGDTDDFSRPSKTEEFYTIIRELEETGVHYKIDPETGFYNVSGHVYLNLLELTSFEGIQFGTVTGNFHCSDNLLTSLKGAPKSVEGDFDCHNNNLTSLVGGPQIVGGSFRCDHNQLTSLKGKPLKIGGDFYHDALPGMSESIEDNLGDVSDYEEPTGIEGQHIRIRIPREDWGDSDARDQRANGRSGIIVRVEEGDEPAVPAFFVVMLDDSNGEIMYLPREWLKFDPMEESVMDPNDRKISFGQPLGKQAVSEGTGMWEGVDDLGDVGDFEEPAGVEGRHVHIQIPAPDWRNADAQEQRLNGRGGTINWIDTEGEPVLYGVLLDETNGQVEALPREWLKFDPTPIDDENDLLADG